MSQASRPKAHPLAWQFPAPLQHATFLEAVLYIFIDVPEPPCLAST